MQQDSINGFLDALNATADRTVDVAKSLVEGKEHMAMTFKQEVVEPKRMESRARCHTFSTPEGFCAYLKKYGSGDSVVVLADPSTGEAHAVLDEKAVKGFEVVSFRPVLHPFWVPWMQCLGMSMTIKAFAKFVVTQKHVIVAPPSKDLFLTLSQVRLSKSVTIEDGFGQHALNGVMVKTVVKGNSVKNPVALPEQIMVRCPIFWNSPETDICIDVIVEVNSDLPGVMLSSSGAEAARIEQVDGMLNDLRVFLPDAVVTFGVIRHGSWDYVGSLNCAGARDNAKPF